MSEAFSLIDIANKASQKLINKAKRILSFGLPSKTVEPGCAMSLHASLKKLSKPNIKNDNVQGIPKSC